MIVLGYTGFTRDSRVAGRGRSPLAPTGEGFEGLFTFRDGEVPFPMFPLGYFGHDASAAILVDGEVVACASEERFTRAKHALNLAGNTLLPRNAVRYCLEAAKVSIRDVDLVAHYCAFRRTTVERRLDQLRPYLSPDDAERVGEAYRRVYGSMLSYEAVLRQFQQMTGTRPRRLVAVSHHEAHAASAYFPSGFEEALVLTIDGSGELESSLLAVGRGRRISGLSRTLLPTSLGTLYLVVTVFLGFGSLDDEYKVMGLASYGDPCRYRDFFASLVRLEGGGRYSITGLAGPDLQRRMVDQLGPPRRPGEPIVDRHADIAAALQEALQRSVLHTLHHARAETGIPNLCMAGGVALNCALNGAIARCGIFEDVFVQPAASDEGCSVGAALHAHHALASSPEAPTRRWRHVYLGPSYDEEDIRSALDHHGDELSWHRHEDIAAATAKEIANGRVVGWFQGRMEFGPRALGNRSILADPRDPEMKDRVNAKVKRRESFRPFAPAVLEEEASTYFDMSGLRDSNFMLFAVPVREDKRASIPAVTHVDGTARLQTVPRDTNPLFWEVIARFRELSGVPVVLNTSFNVRNEPIVCSPEDAIRCFLSTEIDRLTMGRFLVEKRTSR